MAVGKLGVVALDCPEPRSLAEFYRSVIGGSLDGDGDWVTLRGDDGVGLAFQRADDWQPPIWPGKERPQQAHVDVEVTDLDVAEKQVLELGARKADYQPGTTFRVFLDPVGHPFCLCAC
ncbi:VOC family protein [Actinopolymorpha alba]|uniref:VOC family protein n=1 Tax=Actinopolymorpha alba TaxID=533267 RepID=UPI0003728EA7|nr:VOC family protein [Actinopolymorpha alba]